jgi:hypothetical protein
VNPICLPQASAGWSRTARLLGMAWVGGPGACCKHTGPECPVCFQDASMHGVESAQGRRALGPWWSGLVLVAPGRTGRSMARHGCRRRRRCCCCCRRRRCRRCCLVLVRLVIQLQHPLLSGAARPAGRGWWRRCGMLVWGAVRLDSTAAAAAAAAARRICSGTLYAIFGAGAAGAVR